MIECLLSIVKGLIQSPLLGGKNLLIVMGLCLACRPFRMESRTEMEMLRTMKGPSTGEVSVHLVTRDSPGSGPHLPAAAFIIPGRLSHVSGEGGIPILAIADLVGLRSGWHFSPFYTYLRSPSYTCKAGLMEDHQAHLCYVYLCTCSQPAQPPLACPAVP